MPASSYEFSLIVPTYNEAASIEGVMLRFFANLQALSLQPEVLVVDDSRDGTEKILEKLAQQHSGLRVIHREGRKGVGSAIRLGISEARGTYAIIFMADAPDDLRYVPSILEKLRQGYALVHTSRFMKGSTIEGYPLVKTIANRLANLFVRVAFFRFDLKDFTSLFKGVNRAAMQQLSLEADQFDVGLEISMKCMRRGLRIVEVPVSWKERESGASKLSLKKQGPHFLRRILRVWLFYW